MESTKTTLNTVEPLARPMPAVAGMTPMLFEHGGWAIYTSSCSHLEGDTLVHDSCDHVFPEWARSIYIWDEYLAFGETCIRCEDCGAVLPRESWLAFARTYKLLNMRP